MFREKNNYHEKGSRGVSATSVIVSILIVIAAVIGGAYLIFLREDIEEGNGSGNSPDQDGGGDGGTFSNTFPSQIGQELIYESSGGAVFSVEVTGENAVLGKDTFRVRAGFGKKEAFVYVGKKGNVWRYETTNDQYYVINHDTGKYFKSTGENGEFQGNQLIGPTPYIGAWWKNKTLSVGKTFNVSSCSIETQCSDSMTVESSENITVPAGEFETYKIKESASNSFIYVDKDTGVLIKIESSEKELYLKNITGL